MASSAADAAAPPSAADGVAYGHASATQCYPAGAGEAVHASRQYASMDGAPGMQMMGLAPDQLPHALAGHPYVYALPPGMMMVPMQPQDADGGHHAEAGMGGGPVRREGMRPNASRRTNYTVDFKRKVVRDALTRPLGNRIRPTCALYPHVEPCQLRKWIRALEAEVRAQPDVQMMLAALEGAPAAGHQGPRPPPPPIMPPLPALAIDAPPAGAVHLTAKWQPSAVAFAAVTPPTDGAEADPRLLAVTRLAIFPRRLRWWATRAKAVAPASSAASTAAPSASAAPSAAPAVA